MDYTSSKSDTMIISEHYSLADEVGMSYRSLDCQVEASLEFLTSKKRI